MISRSTSYEYRVASISISNDTSAFNDITVFELPKPPVDVVSVFYVRNIAEGVLLSLPDVTDENRKSYIIYRRKSTDGSFDKLATINAKDVNYTDTAVTSNEIYVYAVSIVENDNREGQLSNSISVRRK